MALSTEHIAYLVGRGCWNVHADLRPTPGFSYAYGDEVVLAGDGVDDLNSVLRFMESYPHGRFAVDTGVFDENQVIVIADDINALKTAYIAAYGNVNKPPMRS